MALRSIVNATGMAGRCHSDTKNVFIRKFYHTSPFPIPFRTTVELQWRKSEGSHEVFYRVSTDLLNEPGTEYEKKEPKED